MANPNIAEAGTNTRFATGNKAGAIKGSKQTVQYKVKRMMAQRLDPTDLENSIKGLLPRNATAKDTIAHIIVTQAINGNMRAVELVTAMVDGKTPTSATVNLEREIEERMKNDPDWLNKT